MTLSSEIIGVQDIAAGEVVGYGSRFQAAGRCASAWWPAAMPTAIRAPLGTPVLVDGVRTRLVGRVSMDMLTVDLTACRRRRSAARWCCGAGLPIDEVAEAAGTIGYELMCALAQRVPVVEG
jgi:alanine racemase